MDRGDDVQSMFISDTLDHLGYKQELIGYRKSLFRKIREYFNKLGPSYTKFYFFGSKAEGTSVFNESDCDCIVVNEQAFCEANLEFGNQNARSIVYKCETVEDTPPGYIRLKLSPESYQSIYQNYDFLNSTFGGYLQSTCYSRLMKLKGSTPKYPVSLMNGLGNFRKVNTDFPLVLNNVNLLAELESRRETYGWPSKEIIELIDWKNATSYVYPIGAEQSDSPHLEWRVSHSVVEQVLMECMNDTQIKIYILLKMIVKPALGRVFGISSYILKNVLFLMCQAVPKEEFRRDRLVPCLIYAIEMLYTFVKNGHMPCYLLPDRNLFPPLTVAIKYNWLQQLTVLREERARMLLNNDTLRNVMIVKVMQPETLLSYAQKREETERLLLMIIKMKAEALARRITGDTLLPNETKSIEDCVTLTETIYDIVIPDWKAWADRGEDVETLVHFQLTQLLS